MNRDQAIAKLKETIRRLHLSYRTEKTYAHWLGRYCAFVSTVEPELSPEKKLEAYLTFLARQDVSASTQNQAFNAILFFYRYVLERRLGDVNALRAKRAVRERTAPSVDQVRALLAAVQDRGGYPVRLITHLLYGCGLRVSEPLDLRIKDVLVSESRLLIREAKGNKDRVVALPCSLMEQLGAQLKLARARWALDRAAGIPVAMPGQLAKKYPSWQFSEAWYWLFPANGTCQHPRTGETVRWRVHESNIQRAVREAARQVGIDGIISPHNLRHAYATHALNAGASIRDVQEAMGHKHIDTTMGYCHAEALRVQSPLDRMGAPC